jgi:hypothetical protein
MKTLYWLIPSIVFLYVLIFAVMIPIRRNQRCNKFRKNLKVGNPCYVYDNEERHYGEVIRISDWITVDFSKTKDFIYENPKSFWTKRAYKREQIYPIV